MNAPYPQEVSKLLDLAERSDDPSWFMAAEESALQVLNRNETGDWVTIFADVGLPIYIHSVLAPRLKIERMNRMDINNQAFP